MASVAGKSNVLPDTCLLNKEWRIGCFIMFCAYGFSICFLNNANSILKYVNNDSSKICNSRSYSPDDMAVIGVTMGAGVGACIIQFCRVLIIRLTDSDCIRHSSAAYTLLCILSVSSFSQILFYTRTVSKTCEDLFAVRLPMTMWAEWQSTVPLMFYLTVILDPVKQKLSLADKLVILGAGTGLFTLILPNLQLPYSLGLISFLIANITMTASLFYLYFDSARHLQSVVLETATMKRELTPIDFMKHQVAKRKFMCSIFLNLFFPIFPLVYYLKALDIISERNFIQLIFILNFLAKNVFCILVMDAHTELLDPQTYQLISEKHANDTRRGFLRYVFHEVRVPLNSVSLGLELLHESKELPKAERETVDVIREATSYMASTLNDVLSIQKIEEGMFKLEYKDFNIRDMINTVVAYFKGQLLSKEILFSKNIALDVPNYVVGDRFRLEHVLGNLISNAIKLSENGGRVIVSAQRAIEFDNNNTKNESVSNNDTQAVMNIRFSVSDEGPGISLEDQEMLFKPFVQIRPGELQQGRGSGVGLAICKDIVALHGGILGCHSALRDYELKTGGSEFYFCIPFGTSSLADDSDSTTPAIEEVGNGGTRSTSTNNMLALVDPTSNTSVVSHDSAGTCNSNRAVDVVGGGGDAAVRDGTDGNEKSTASLSLGSDSTSALEYLQERNARDLSSDASRHDMVESKFNDDGSVATKIQFYNALKPISKPHVLIVDGTVSILNEYSHPKFN